MARVLSSSSWLWQWTQCCPLITSLTSEWILRVTKPCLVNRQKSWYFLHSEDGVQIIPGKRPPTGGKGPLVLLGSDWPWLSFSSDAYFADYTSAAIFGAKILQKPTPMVEQPASPFLELYETQLRSESRAVLPGEHRIPGKLDGDLEWWKDLWDSWVCSSFSGDIVQVN